MTRGGRDGGLDGVLVVAKPSGPTSHDVVALVRRLSSTRRVGHGGTLDPFAAGVLPVFLGRATRLVEYHLGASKRYRATICFGERSTTDDIDGERTPVDGPPVTREAVEAGLAAFTGPIRQVPPDYSAVQVEGRRAYQLARAGTPVELAPRQVTIHALDLVEWEAADPARPIAVVDVHCSAGTYIRALARDLGEHLGTGAYLGALVRTASGGFRLEDALSLDDLRAGAADGPAGVAAIMRPIDAGLEDLPHAPVTDDEIRRLGEGLITAPKTPLGLRDAPVVLAVGPDGRVAAVCAAVSGALHPHKVLAERVAGPARRCRVVDVIAGLDALDHSHEPVFVVVGVFDGLHLGHAYLLRHLVLEATARSARPVVITFDHHPDEVLVGNAPPLLCDPVERLERLAGAGVDTTVVVHFDQRLRETTYDAFVDRIASRAPLAGFLMTPEAAFGYQRAGHPGGACRPGRGARVRGRRRAAVRGRRPGRSAARRCARRSPPATSTAPRGSSAGPTPWSATRSARARGASSGFRSPSPCPPMGHTGSTSPRVQACPPTRAVTPGPSASPSWLAATSRSPARVWPGGAASPSSPGSSPVATRVCDIVSQTRWGAAATRDGRRRDRREVAGRGRGLLHGCAGTDPVRWARLGRSARVQGL